jgi:hypothetical protein
MRGAKRHGEVFCRKHVVEAIEGADDCIEVLTEHTHASISLDDGHTRRVNSRVTQHCARTVYPNHPESTLRQFGGQPTSATAQVKDFGVMRNTRHQQHRDNAQPSQADGPPATVVGVRKWVIRGSACGGHPGNTAIHRTTIPCHGVPTTWVRGATKRGPGGGLGTGAHMKKRREDSEADTECHPGIERRAGQGRCIRRLSCFCDIGSTNVLMVAPDASRPKGYCNRIISYTTEIVCMSLVLPVKSPERFSDPIGRSYRLRAK